MNSPQSLYTFCIAPFVQVNAVQSASPLILRQNECEHIFLLDVLSTRSHLPIYHISPVKTNYNAYSICTLCKRDITRGVSAGCTHALPRCVFQENSSLVFKNLRCLCLDGGKVLVRRHLHSPKSFLKAISVL